MTAHPDDVDFGSAGSIATLAAQGVQIAYCLVTDGDAGGSDRTVSRAEMASLRRAEQTTAQAHGLPEGRFAEGFRVVANL